MTGNFTIKKLLTLGRNERVKSRKLINTLFTRGQRFSNSPLRVLFLFTSDSAFPLQAGFGVGTKHFKKAVDRNRIKRLLREGYRLHKGTLEEQMKHKQQQLSVFFIYTGHNLPDTGLVFDKIKGSLDVLIDKTKDLSPKNA